MSIFLVFLEKVIFHILHLYLSHEYAEMILQNKFLK